MRAYVGLDIHSKSSTYVVQDARGKHLYSTQLTESESAVWPEQPKHQRRGKRARCMQG